MKLHKLLPDKLIVLTKLAYLQGAGMMLVFASNLLLTNLLTDDNYGTYVSIVQAISLFGIFLIGGLDELITVEMPIHLKNEDHAAANALHRWADRTLYKRFFILLIPAVILYTGYWSLTEKWTIQPVQFCLAILCALASTHLLKITSEYRAVGKYTMAQILESVARPIGLPLVLIAAVYLLHVEPTTTTTLLILLLVSFATLLLFKQRLYRDQPHLRDHHNSPEPKILPYESGRQRLAAFNWSSILYFLLIKVDLLILILLEPAAVVGQYNISSRLAEWCMIPAILINISHTRDVAEAGISGESKKLPNLVKKLIAQSAVFTFLSAVFLVLIGYWVLPLFGKNYIGGYQLLLPLTISYLLMATAAPVNHWLKIIGKESRSVQITWIVVAFQLVVCSVLIYWLGPIGAAVGMILSNTLYLLLQFQTIRSVR